MAPTVLVLCVLAAAMALFSYWQARHLYQDLQKDNLTSFLNTSRNVLATATPSGSAQAHPTRSDIRHALNQTSLPQGVGLYIFNPAGKVLFHKGAGSEAYFDDHLSHLRRLGDSASHSFVTSEGETIAGMQMPSRNVLLAIYSQNTFKDTPQSRNIINQVLVIVPLAIMVAIALLFATLHFSLFSPLRRLTHGMRRIIRDEAYDTSIPPRGSREIQELSASFNNMTSALKERGEALKAYSDGLETLVKQRTRALEQAQQKLVLHERLAAIGEFASTVVHELRNPLAAIKMAIERLNMQNSDEKTQRSLGLARQQVQRLDDMLRGILDFAANRPSNIEPVPLKDFFKEMEPHLAAAEETHNIKFTRPRPKGALAVLADRNKLEQIVLNVLKNAAEYAPEGTKVALTCAEKEKAGNKTIEIKVKNQGDPIPDGVKSRLFEPFYTTKKGGTGLGLPTSRKLLEEMDGSITIKNSKTGVIVTLTLPPATE